MNPYRVLFLLLPFALILGAMPACSLDIPIEDEVSDPDAITDLESAKSALAAAYKSYSLWQYNTQLSARTDDFTPTPLLAEQPDLGNIYSWNERQLVFFSTAIWDEGYRTIVLTNILLERIAPLLKHDLGEDYLPMVGLRNSAQALQALVLFQLAQLYGDNPSDSPCIPLRKHAELAYPARESRGEVMQYIRTLLEPAISAKPNELWLEGVYWLNPLSALCLLVEVELSEGNYDLASEYVNRLVLACDAKGIPSLSSYQRMWRGGSSPAPNVLFAVDVTASPSYSEFDSWSDAVQGDPLVVNPNLEFKPGDIRQEVSYSLITMADKNSPTGSREARSYGKYNALRNQNKPIEYICLYRAADVLLLAAEAEAQRGSSTLALARLNSYLSARNAQSITAPLSGQELLQRIYTERQLEFLGEGKRFYDLKRMPNRPAVLRYRPYLSHPVDIASDDFRWLLPIPPSETKYNPNVGQNPEWNPYVLSK